MDDAPHSHPGTGHDTSATMIADEAEAPANGATRSKPSKKPAPLKNQLPPPRRHPPGEHAGWVRTLALPAFRSSL